MSACDCAHLSVHTSPRSSLPALSWVGRTSRLLRWRLGSRLRLWSATGGILRVARYNGLASPFVVLRFCFLLVARDSERLPIVHAATTYPPCPNPQPSLVIWTQPAPPCSLVRTRLGQYRIAAQLLPRLLDGRGAFCHKSRSDFPFAASYVLGLSLLFLSRTLPICFITACPIGHYSTNLIGHSSSIVLQSAASGLITPRRGPTTQYHLQLF